MKIVINRCFGGFGLSDAAYLKLIEWGIPVRKYVMEQRNPNTLRYEKVADNEGEVIFDRELTPESEDTFNYHKYKQHSWMQRYWEVWTSGARTHPLIVRVVEELGAAANGPHAELAIVEVPDGVEWEIDEYDGNEHIAETHRTWR